MAEVPETRYARNGGVSLAYHVFGKGAVLVGIPPFAQNIEMAWEDSRCRRMLTAFGSFSRFVHFGQAGHRPRRRAVARFVAVRSVPKPLDNEWRGAAETVIAASNGRVGADAIVSICAATVSGRRRR